MIVPLDSAFCKYGSSLQNYPPHFICYLSDSLWFNLKAKVKCWVRARVRARI